MTTVMMIMMVSTMMMLIMRRTTLQPQPWPEGKPKPIWHAKISLQTVNLINRQPATGMRKINMRKGNNWQWNSNGTQPQSCQAFQWLGKLHTFSLCPQNKCKISQLNLSFHFFLFIIWYSFFLCSCFTDRGCFSFFVRVALKQHTQAHTDKFQLNAWHICVTFASPFLIYATVHRKWIFIVYRRAFKCQLRPLKNCHHKNKVLSLHKL